MKAKTKLTKLLSILLALVMVVGLLPTTALAEEPDAFLQFIKAPGEIFYRNDGANDSDGPTVDTTFTLTEPTMITGIWTYHCNVEYYDIDFSKQTIQLKDTATDTVVYSGAVRVGHYYNTIDCDWLVIPNIILPVGTYQLIDSHHDSWSALNKKGVCAIKGYSYTPSETADFSTDPTAALSFLNTAKTGTTYSTWDSDTNTLTLNGVNFESSDATAVRLPADSTIVLNGVNTIKGGNSDSGDCYGIEGLGNLTIQGTGKLNVTSGTTSRTAYDSFGIRAASVTIKSGTVIAKGGTAQMTEGSMSGGIYGSNYITIEGGIVEATGDAAWRSCGFSIVALGNMYISGGTVTATGGTATEEGSYGIYTAYSAYVNITGGSLIAKAGSAPYAKALPWAPAELPTIYWWRSSDSGQYKKGYFNLDDVSTYVEIVNTEPITTYTVTFDANSGTGTMADVTGVSGEYTLPANGFTAPEGKQFKCWNVGGAEKAVGDKITVTANITVTAVWENIPAGPCVNHKAGTAVKENVKKATCKAEGSYDSVVYCSVCNSEISRTPKVIPKSAHKYDTGKVTKAATCKATGVKTYTCTVCKATKTETIAKKAHTYKNYVTKATLTANGKIVNKCSVCGVVKSTTAVPLIKTVTISATNYNYDGKIKTPAVTVKDSKGKTLRKGTDYDVTYSSGRKNVGKYAVKITLKGNYYGTKTLYFNINPKGTTIAKLTPKSKSLTVQWNKQTNQTTGYQIQYSTASNFSGAKTITMLKNTYYAKTITGLSGNKRYYVRIRTYKKVGNTNYYSSWSSAKSVTTKK